MKDFDFKFLCKTKFALIAISLLTLTQLMVGYATFSIVKVGASIASPEPDLIYLSIFLLMTVLVYVPEFFARVSLEKWTQDRIWKFTDAFVERFSLRMDLRDSRIKGQTMPFIYKEAHECIREAKFFVYDTFAIILNTLVSILVLSYVISSLIIASYLVGITVVTIFLYRCNRRIKEKSARAQDKRIHFTDLLANSWDTVTIGNRYNLRILYRRLIRRFELSSSSVVSLEFFTNAVSTTSILLLSVPVYGSLVYSVWTNTEPGMLGIIIATLPRQITTIQHSQIMIHYVTKIPSIKTRMHGVSKAVMPPENVDLGYRIDWEKISFLTESGERELFTNIEEVLEYLKNRMQGRLTISGPNGSGKSTILSMLKSGLGTEAYILPAEDLQTYLVNHMDLSTGQALVGKLTEISRPMSSDVVYLLLDEWDANLDRETKASVDDHIKELSKSLHVIDISHQS